MTLTQMLDRIERATVPMDARRIGDRAYLANREMYCCNTMLTVVRLVPLLVAKRDALRERQTLLRRRDVRTANRAGNRTRIDNDRVQVETVLRAAVQAVAGLKREMATIAELQRSHSTRQGPEGAGVRHAVSRRVGTE
jgi:hypothetical protein